MAFLLFIKDGKIPNSGSLKIRNNFDEELTVIINDCAKDCPIQIYDSINKGWKTVDSFEVIVPPNKENEYTTWVSYNNQSYNCSITSKIKGNNRKITVNIADFTSSRYESAQNTWCNIDPRDQCFPADAKIKIKSLKYNQSCINIKDVKIGDNILVGPNKYRPVIGFSHKNSVSEFDFLCIKYEIKDETNKVTNDETNNTLHMTSGHFIPASKSINDKLVYIQAADLKVGMFIQNINNDQINLVKIIEISNVKKRGLFCIHTDNYDVVVDNIIVSSYTSSININFAHTLISIANIFPLTISAYLIENIPALRLFLLKKEIYFGSFILIIMTLLLKLIGY